MSDDQRARDFRKAVGQFATGVCVITSHTDKGPTGLTLNAFTSLSLDPLLVVVCFDLESRTLAAAKQSKQVAVNVLASSQAELSAVFASKATEAEKFAGVAWSERAGSPVLDGVVAWFAGPLRDLIPGGDHLIGVVEVEEFGASGGEPLIFHDGAYGRLGLR